MTGIQCRNAVMPLRGSGMGITRTRGRVYLRGIVPNANAPLVTVRDVPYGGVTASVGDDQF